MTGTKLFGLIGAIDGGQFMLDDKEVECYVFDDEKKFESVKTMWKDRKTWAFFNGLCAN